MPKRKVSKRKKAELVARDLRSAMVRCAGQAVAITVVAAAIAVLPHLLQMANVVHLSASMTTSISTFALFVGAMLASARAQACMRARKDLKQHNEVHSLNRANAL